MLFFLAFAQCESNTYAKGEAVYQAYCSNCHMDDGMGLKRVYPPLKSDYAKLNFNNLACIIQNGLDEEIIVNKTKYHLAMEGYPQINEFQMTNLINYINHKFELDQSYQSVYDIRKQLKNCKN